MRNRHTQSIRDIDWLYEKLKVVLLEMNERDWSDLAIQQYYDKAILELTRELQHDRKTEQDRERDTEPF